MAGDDVALDKVVHGKKKSGGKKDKDAMNIGAEAEKKQSKRKASGLHCACVFAIFWFLFSFISSRFVC